MTPRCGSDGRRLLLLILLGQAVVPHRAASVDVPGSTDSDKFALDTAAAKKVAGGWELPRHTFSRRLTYDDNLGLWLQSGATMALRDRVTLIPEVPDRYGMLWHKEPVNTTDFHVRFQMRLNLTEKLEHHDLLSKDSHLTFWLTPDDVLQDYEELKIVQSGGGWKEGLNAIGYSLYGNKPTFRGLMMSFGIGSEGGKATQGVTVGWNNGEDFSTSRAAQQMKTFTPIDWEGIEFVELTVRVQLPNVIFVVLRQPTASRDIEKTIFSLGPAHGKVTGWDGSYFGFTAYSGSDISAEVNVQMVETLNFDVKRVGESVSASDSDTTGGTRSADMVKDIEEWEDMLRREQRQMTQRSQSQAIDKLSELLGKHMERFSEMGSEVQAKLVELGSRMDMLETNLGTTLAGLEAFNIEAGAIDVSAVKEHVVGLKTAFKSLAALHDGTVHQVQEETLKLKPRLANDAVKQDRQVKVKAATMQVSVLESQVSKSSQQTGWMMLTLIMSVTALGLLFLRRMRYYEKKHFI